MFKKHNEEDFEEFLRRQSKFLNKREAKINAAIEVTLQLRCRPGVGVRDEQGGRKGSSTRQVACRGRRREALVVD